MSNNTNQVETIIRPRSPWHFLDLAELWEYRELFYILSWRDLKVRYKQTVLGVSWALFQPLINMIIFTVFFGNFASIPSDGLPYPVFVLLGLTFWGFFSNALSRAGNSFIENEQLVKKVYFPREILTFSAVITSFIDFLISLFILIIVIAYYGIAVNIPFIGIMLLGILITAISSIGFGLFLASVNIKYRDVRYALPFFLQTLIFVTPVIYATSILGKYQWLFYFNPMSGVIETMRAGLLGTGAINWWLLGASAVFGIIIFFLGILLFFKIVFKFFSKTTCR